MKREIKFRAFGHTDIYVPYKMHYGVSVSHAGIPEIAGVLICDHVLMQYTGLKDRNGKEIYEGDVVSNGLDGVVEYFSDLTWDGGCLHPGFYCQEWFEFNEPCELAYPHNFDDCEVIGNIYENPELLEVEG